MSGAKVADKEADIGIEDAGINVAEESAIDVDVDVDADEESTINTTVPLAEEVSSPLDEPFRMGYEPRYKDENPRKFGGTYTLYTERGGEWEQVGHIDTEFVHHDKNYYNGLVPRKTMRIIYAVVEDDRQGMGYGKKLVDYVEAEGKSYGMRRSYANNVMQQSVGFWMRMGYEELVKNRRIWLKKLCYAERIERKSKQANK